MTMVGDVQNVQYVKNYYFVVILLSNGGGGFFPIDLARADNFGSTAK